jgi:putative SOS response-associated peptidase YedK
MQQFLFDLGDLPADLALAPRYNVAPTQTVAAVRQSPAGGRRQLGLFRWGLIPSWAKEAKMAAPLVNARAETVAEKPAFRSALARRRCLVLADGYLEWQKVGKEKRPLYYRMKDERPFAFAGLWERWRGPDGGKGEGDAGEPLESCTIITTEANELAKAVHDRMPVILHPSDYDVWLNPAQNDSQQVLKLLKPYAAEEMKAEPVSMRVNNVRNDDAACLAPAAELF